MNDQAIDFTDTITNIEELGLRSPYNLAVAHSHLDCQKIFPEVVTSLPGIWQFAAKIPSNEMSSYYKQTFARFFEIDGLAEHNHFSVCSSASSSIDIAAAFLSARDIKVGLIEPTCDSIAQIFKRRGVALSSVPELLFQNDKELEDLIEKQNIKALFLVNPNNPTGAEVSEAEFKNLISLAKRLNIILIVDGSFRFCREFKYDEYELLKDSGVSFILIEDTGKMLPSLDVKSSILAYSSDIATEMRAIYSELYLCPSNFSMALIAAFLKACENKGGVKFFKKIIAYRRSLLEQALDDSTFEIACIDTQKKMSVAWVDIGGRFGDDIELTRIFHQLGIVVLPGRGFFWDGHLSKGHNYVRIALLQPDKKFYEAIEIIRNFCFIDTAS